MESVTATAPESAVGHDASESGLRTLLRAKPIGVAALLLGAALVTWIVTIERMRGMDMGPGTDLGSLGWYVGIWVTMMAAMMLPSAAPMVLVYSRVSRERARRGRAYVPTWIFVAGYLAAWTAYGLVAYGVYRVIVAADPGFLAWDEQGPYVAGGAIVLAGLYQLTPLKARCLGSMAHRAAKELARLAEERETVAVEAGRVEAIPSAAAPEAVDADRRISDDAETMACCVSAGRVDV